MALSTQLWHLEVLGAGDPMTIPLMAVLAGRGGRGEGHTGLGPHAETALCLKGLPRAQAMGAVTWGPGLVLKGSRLGPTGFY